MSRTERMRRELVETVRLAAPVVVVYLGQMLMGVVDTMMLGHVSGAALAAGALGHISTLFLLALGLGILSALDPLVAQAYGAQDDLAVGSHLQRGIVLAAGMSIPMGFFFWNVGPVLRLLGQPAEVVGDAAAFARGILWGAPAYFLFLAFRQTLQAMSVVRPAALVIVLGNVLNVLGNYILIYGHFGFPALGVAGSAYSTSISRWAMFFALLVAGRHQLAPYWRGFQASEALDLRRHLRLLRLGLPIGFHQSIEILYFSAMALLVGRIGVVALAGHQIAINLASLSFMVPLGIAGAAATRVGNAVGRQDMPGARRAAAACLFLGAGTMLVFAALFTFLPEPLARLYTRDPAVIAMTAVLLPIAAVFQVCDGLQVVSAGVLRGTADTALPAALALVGFWGVGLPAGWWLAYRAGQGVQGLWWGMNAALLAVAALLLMRIVSRFRGTIARTA